MCVSYSVKYIYVHTYIEYIYREIKEIRTQLSIAAYLFACPKQHVDPARPSASPMPTLPNAIPSVDVCLTVGSWVIFYANCKLSVKIVVIGLIQQCQPKCLAWRAGQRGWEEQWQKERKATEETAETAENQ